MPGLIEPLGWMLVHSVWMISLIVLVAAVVSSSLHRRAANARYFVACLALMLSISVLPCVFAWMMLQRQEMADSLVDNTRTIVRFGETMNRDGSGEAGTEMQSGFTAQSVPLQPADAQTTDGNQIIEGTVAHSSETSAIGSTARPSLWLRIESRLRPYLVLLVSSWLVGVCLFSLRPVVGWYSARRLQRVGLSEVSDSLREMLSRLSRRLGLKKTVRLFQSSLTQMPCVIGAFRPVILLPASAISGLSTDQLEALLAHELAHIRRHDFAMNVLQTLVETLLFYHPAIWWLSSRIRQEREHCCDDLAISVCGDVAGYARMLVSVESLRGQVPHASVAASGGSLVERIRRLLSVTPEQTRSPWITGFMVLAMATMLIGSWQLSQGQVSGPPANQAAETNRVSAATGQATETPKSEHVNPVSDEDWPQWGRTSLRNNVANGPLPREWDLEKGTNIVWTAKLGTETYSSPVVSRGKVFIGTNNGAGFNPAHPKENDMSCLVCFDEATGKFLWQYASEKLPAGRGHDWPNIGHCSTACVDGDRVWIVTNRCEVVCLDANGYRDGENDGPFSDEPAPEEIEADVIWKFDMIGELGVRPRHQPGSSITVVDSVLLLNTSNEPDETHVKIPAPGAPNFLALDATTGRVIWKENTAGKCILGGFPCSCSGASPSVATIGGVTQAIFTGKDGWVYGYDFAELKLGRTTLLWQFDCNPKTAKHSRRNALMGSPVVADGLVYVATGHNPENGEGEADLWCIDPTKRGDISSELVFNKSFENGEKPIPHKLLCACETDKGDFVRRNPNSGAIWHFASCDHNGNGKIDFEETFRRSLGSPVIHDGLLFIADFSGLLHCFDSKTGVVEWTNDLWAATYSNCLIADGHVLIGDEDGEVNLFKAARTKQSVFGDMPPSLGEPIYSTPAVINGTLFIAAKNSLVAIRDPKPSERLNAAATPQTVADDVFSPLDVELVDAVTGQPIAEDVREVTFFRRLAAPDNRNPRGVNVKATKQVTLNVTGSFHFILPTSGDVEEKRITVRVYSSKSSHQITLAIPDEILRRADRDELLLEWKLGNALVYENYEPIERIPLKRLLSNDPTTGRDSFRTIKLTPKHQAAVPSSRQP
jgi:beta-lactamase regulating signal transducer with metallopeptidase domain/outer membrane protein assembly factor BamB